MLHKWNTMVILVRPQKESYGECFNFLREYISVHECNIGWTMDSKGYSDEFYGQQRSF
jgi:hypothetical protein